MTQIIITKPGAGGGSGSSTVRIPFTDMDIIELHNLSAIPNVQIWIQETLPFEPSSQYNVIGGNTNQYNGKGQEAGDVYRILPESEFINKYNPVDQTLQIELDDISTGIIVYNI